MKRAASLLAIALAASPVCAADVAVTGHVSQIGFFGFSTDAYGYDDPLFFDDPLFITTRFFTTIRFFTTTRCSTTTLCFQK